MKKEDLLSDNYLKRKRQLVQTKHADSTKQQSTCMNGDFHKLLTSKTLLKNVFKGDKKNVEIAGKR